ncbi:endo-1,4-beta-xylanase I [Stachybotrys elegans]|uniref:Endo-1,4-beta-xylanase n=1 Tax=Stachybotrys elegans TaxID=80388 RepID=A0A8K0WPK7_9HYPO|nr:endo-1,4-beta-xylanase I [Stachybotrys elegans]
MLFSSILAAAALLTGVSAGPVEVRQSGVTPNQEGTHNGYFFSWWSDGASPVSYVNGNGGSYTVTWQRGGNLVGGKGWNPGTGRTIQYTADWRPVNNGNSYLAIYGWTRSPLVEYYVLEAFGEYNPASGATKRGEVVLDGATYDILHSMRYNAPSIDGTQTFAQYWAVRRNHRTSGSVNMSAVFSAWAAAGMNLGNHYYQIVATEAYNSQGTCTVNVLSPP